MAMLNANGLSDRQVKRERRKDKHACLLRSSLKLHASSAWKRGNCECIPTWGRFNYDTMPSLKSVNLSIAVLYS